MFNNSREIDLIKQQGPTCGIYAIAMIINKIYPDICEHEKEEQVEQNRQELAYKIFKLAINSGVSEIGELFEYSKIERLLTLINCEILTKNQLYYEIIQFRNKEEMREKLECVLKGSQYVMFPYFLDKFNKNNSEQKNKISHWGALYSINKGMIYGVEGLNKKGKNKGLRGIYYEELFNSNSWLNGEFEWRYYYKYCKRLDRKISSFCSLTNNADISKDLKELEVPNKRRIRKKKRINYDMVGKMILIESLS